MSDVDDSSPIPFPIIAHPVRVLAAPVDVAEKDLGGNPITQLLARILREESALYAITREWRYNTAALKFLRLHALLDAQFSDIGIRLTQISGRCLALNGWTATSPGERGPDLGTPAPEQELEAHILRHLLGLHDAMVTRLRSGSALIEERFHDRPTVALLADLGANHERDAFMLRALLWEVQHEAV